MPIHSLKQPIKVYNIFQIFSVIFTYFQMFSFLFTT